MLKLLSSVSFSEPSYLFLELLGTPCKFDHFHSKEVDGWLHDVFGV